MRRILTAAVLFICVAILAQTPTQYVTLTGANANYGGGTATATFVAGGGAIPPTKTASAAINAAGTFSLIGWNNSAFNPSSTTFTICTASKATCYTTPPVVITQSQDISSYLTLAPIPR